MATTPAGIRYPISTDPIDIPGDMLNLATDVDTYVTTTIASDFAAQNAVVEAALAQNVQDVEDALGSLAQVVGFDVGVIMGAY